MSKKQLISGWAAAVLVSAIAAVSFAEEKAIETGAGQSFTISLEANATTGYTWQFAQPLDENMLELLDSSYEVDNPGLTGSGGKQIWKIKALNPGNTVVSFIYVRPWEKDKAPAKKVSFAVRIKEKQEGPGDVRLSGDVTITGAERKGF